MLGNELRKAREKAEMTQEQLALDADVDRTYISMLENDKKSPTVELLFRLCDAMDIAASEILRRVERGDPDESKE
jgi:transcriptional regulator with XRE-family HTH domain